MAPPSALSSPLPRLLFFSLSFFPSFSRSLSLVPCRGRRHQFGTLFVHSLLTLLTLFEANGSSFLVPWPLARFGLPCLGHLPPCLAGLILVGTVFRTEFVPISTRIGPLTGSELKSRETVFRRVAVERKRSSFFGFFLQTTPVPFQRFPLETLVCSFVSHTGHDFGILFYGNRSRAKGEGAGRRRQRRLRPATRNWRRRRRRKRQVETLPDSFSASFQRLWARGGTDDFWRGHSGFPDRFFFFFLFFLFVPLWFISSFWFRIGPNRCVGDEPLWSFAYRASVLFFLVARS